jgi:hypothetical protein
MVDEIERELEGPGPGTTVAVLLTASAASMLAILPAAIALHAPGLPPGWVASALGTLAVVIATGKVAAMAWGAGSRLWGLHRASVAAAYAD